MILKNLTPALELKNLQLQLAKTKANPACFVAGTLIHTKNGLVPIEQIKVGDWVLSQPEDKGELSYKPVTRTFVHESNDLFLIGLGCYSEDREKIPNFVAVKEIAGKKCYLGREWIVATGGHPFFTKEKGWVAAGDLPWTGLHLELVNGLDADAGWVTKIFQTEAPALGWSPRDPGGEKLRHGDGYTVDFGNDGFKFEHSDCAPKAEWDFDLGQPMFRTVYNFEVADNHTYYVGTLA